MQRRLFLMQMAIGATFAALGLPKFGRAATPAVEGVTRRSSRFYLHGDKDSGGCAVSGSYGNLHERYPQSYSV